MRDEVFAAICTHLSDLEAYSIVIRKNRTNPSLREPHVLYRRTFEWLVRYACPRAARPGDHVVAVTDHIPIDRNRAAFEKALKPYLKQHLQPGATYELFHHQSKSDLSLQVADYISWAIYRKWNAEDLRSYRLIEPCVRSEGDLFRHGDTEYY
ncbi:MAG: hypothetical protein Q8M55_07510 [Actinomycetota bacterium]|nr:hypothetical protein [Actinomycetota bacterium]